MKTMNKIDFKPQELKGHGTVASLNNQVLKYIEKKNHFKNFFKIEVLDFKKFEIMPNYTNRDQMAALG